MIWQKSEIKQGAPATTEQGFNTSVCVKVKVKVKVKMKKRLTQYSI